MITCKKLFSAVSVFNVALSRRVVGTARSHMVFVSLSMFRVLMVSPHGRDITECPVNLSGSEE